jgi:Multicopper oxidase
MRSGGTQQSTSMVTRPKALFDRPGLFVWRCHTVEHEDNEMMRPYFHQANPPALAKSALR